MTIGLDVTSLVFKNVLAPLVARERKMLPLNVNTSSYIVATARMVHLTCIRQFSSILGGLKKVWEREVIFK